jgi:thioredoxin 1
MMKRSSLFVGMLSLMFLTGCNWWTKKEEAPQAGEIEATAQVATEGEKVEAKEVVSNETTIKAIESADDFKNAISGNKLVVAKFYTDWCGACNEMKPAFDAIASAYAGKCTFITINTDKVKDVAEAEKITGIPAIIIYKNGQSVDADKTVGAITKEALEIKVKEALDEEHSV